MNRRAFITTVIAGVATGSIAWQSIEPYDESLSIDATLSKLDKMRDSTTTTTGSWSLYQVLIHCAQSVEYSMSGFPEHKSEFFKNTAGKLAFSAFSAKGKMTHGLDEAIPGAPAIADSANLTKAYARLQQSLKDFQTFDGRLKPHFAYGKLTKAQYEQAHVMHFNNHLNEISIV